ncbi:MAG: CDP-glucose 4,6-dehydratase [Spirochaetota bacterium]
METLFNNIYKNKKVIVTGHTGFKGSWLALWLNQLGADVCGYSLEAPTQPNHFSLLSTEVQSIFDDIRNKEAIGKAINAFKPDIIFHLAAQSLVRPSYQNPVETFETNVIGTLNVFEACRKLNSVKAIVNITSDKCYENQEWLWGYRENDPMGGFDPYSASKGCSEIATSSFRNSFFNIDRYGFSHNTLLASARAGNVIGGGDWAVDRLIPDIMRATDKSIEVLIRSPHAIRPWQHVLEPLSGYLLLGQKLLQEKKEYADAWNFGPNHGGAIEVIEVLNTIKKYWDKINYTVQEDINNPHEAALLRLDCSKAHLLLNWNPVWDINSTIEKTACWYKSFYEQKELLSKKDLNNYIKDAKKKNIVWTNK